MQQAGVPLVGFTWYSLTDQVDWDIALASRSAGVDPVGLFDLNRDPRAGRPRLQASDRHASRPARTIANARRWRSC